MSRLKSLILFFLISAAVASGVAIIAFIALGRIKNSEAFSAASEHIKKDTLVLKKFGLIEGYSFVVSGSVNRNSASLRFGFDGSIKDGKVRCNLVKGPDDKWIVEFIEYK